MNYRELHEKAHAAGHAAAVAAIPVPMIVRPGDVLVNGEDVLNGKSYYVSEGACGFAWINVPGNSAYGRFAKKVLGAHKDYPSGVAIWVGDYNQSVTRKEAYANAYARVLNENGVKAYPRSRLD